MNENINKIIRFAYDLHFHIGPEIIPRKFNNVDALIESEENKIAGIALKNHFYPTVPLIKQSRRQTKIKLIGSVALNNFIGGMNSEAIYATSLITDDPFIVWFPTVNSENFLKKSPYEVPWEWVQKDKFSARQSKLVKPVNIKEGKNLNLNVIKVLEIIRRVRAILATGHISANETVQLATKARQVGVKKIIITHPIYQRIDMSIKDQKNLTKAGCFIELCYSMYSIDKIPISKIAYQINKIGSNQIILSSDVGQKFSTSPSVALTEFCRLLINEGITMDMLYTMLVKNPRRLIEAKYP